MTRVNNWLTDDQLAEILSGVVDGVEPTTQELTMAAELQERRKADSVRPVGYVSESAIFCLGLGWHEVITAKPEKDADDARYWDVIPLYAAPPVQETGVYKDMLNIIGLLENNEWAEHCTNTVLGSLLESEITRLVSKEQQAPAASSESVSLSLTDALRDVIAERQRQVSVKGWTPDHDDTYTCGELSGAAISYIEPMEAVFYWPAEWHDDSFKPSDERRNLVKATALLLAEIERLDRISAASALSEVDHDDDK
ncbi:TPA: hypothetical protein ACJGK5_003163 [Salmonella enterica subsp. enterica serovar Enteritidis]